MFPSSYPRSPLIINMSDWHKAACSKVCVVAPNDVNRKKKGGIGEMERANLDRI